MALEEDQAPETNSLVDWLKSVPALVKFPVLKALMERFDTGHVVHTSSRLEFVAQQPATSLIGFVKSPNELKTSRLATGLARAEELDNVQWSRRRSALH